MRILIADDEQEIVDLLSIYLKSEGYQVIPVNDGRAAWEQLLSQNDIGLAILDIMMPEMDGLEVVEKMRNQGISIPVLIVSAKSSDNDKILGLLSGADDYVVKPFNPSEVMARVKSLLRRQYNYAEVSKDSNLLEVGPLVIAKDSHQVRTTDGKDIQLTASEFGILYLLASNPNKVFSAENIFDEVWQQEGQMSAKTVMVHVSHLRDKLAEATGGNKVVQTVWGVGYKIEA
ncbi:response regulator transcription factor [Ignavigranum ruoffiae]|uniref:DNA-binding response regulator, OmpR family, contains REC and winged-helix (WHTH) domain n=1 Tax=Ignavigranum ruoffiae TaxID=89093 RepID=A0A1H9BXA2_9LACT|nr:response regulator transcription factor [Ignavigranum ruoffiae]UPQ86405.1 response regulator transcription factor [Ignavigranum ruoffiae]SEP93595.1 DNA-binding response regulator, OmpR family, contains REC and winged-helix (wHTH) domain [Ignavigranum ruoffiae]